MQVRAEDQPVVDDVGALVGRAQSGEAPALEQLLTRVRPVVLRRCSRMLPHHQDAEDATQEALLSVARNLDRYSGRGSFEGWVTVIASNAARQAYRGMRRRFVETTGEDLVEPADPRTTSVIAGSRLWLMEALEGLEARHPATVDAFVLRDLGALPYAEIAAQLDVPEGTVKARVHTARTSLREDWGPGGHNF